MAMKKLLSRSGIANNTTVVAYGSYPGTGAWIFWLLKLFGHLDVRVLNGGHQKWLAQGRPVSAELASFPLVPYHIQSVDNNLRVSQAEVLSSIGQRSRVLLDVRSLQEYSGEHFLMQPPEGIKRAGHIPSSIHLEFIHTLNADGTFKSMNELQELYRSKGITPEINKSFLTVLSVGVLVIHGLF